MSDPVSETAKALRNAADALNSAVVSATLQGLDVELGHAIAVASTKEGRAIEMPQVMVLSCRKEY